MIVLIAMLRIACGTVAALPIKPKLSDIIKEAQKPQVHYPPARAGWNGPEEKPAALQPNAAYDQLRYAMSAEAARSQFMQAATPDWRALMALATIIFAWRYRLDRSFGGNAKGKDNVIAMPDRPATAGNRAA